MFAAVDAQTARQGAARRLRQFVDEFNETASARAALLLENDHSKHGDQHEKADLSRIAMLLASISAASAAPMENGKMTARPILLQLP